MTMTDTYEIETTPGHYTIVRSLDRIHKGGRGSMCPDAGEGGALLVEYQDGVQAYERLSDLFIRRADGTMLRMFTSPGWAATGPAVDVPAELARLRAHRAYHMERLERGYIVAVGRVAAATTDEEIATAELNVKRSANDIIRTKRAPIGCGRVAS